MREKISDILKKLTVRIVVEKYGFIGSGVLCPFDNQYGYIYVFTAKHCVLGDKYDYETPYADIKVQFKFNDEDDFITFEVNCLINSDKDDFSILCLSYSEVQKYIPQFPSNIKVLNGTVEKCSYRFRGYPQALNAIIAHPLECTYVESTGNHFRIKSNSPIIDTSADNATYIMKGYSGSGVFIEVDKVLYLLGIVNQLLNENGSFSAIKCLSLKNLNELLSTNHLPTIKFLDTSEVETKINESNTKDMSVQELIDYAKLHYNKKDYSTARKYYEHAILRGLSTQKERTQLQKNVNVCNKEFEYNSLLKEGDKYKKNGYLDKALKNYLEARKIFRRKQINEKIESVKLLQENRF